jgi:hypothetical protein
MAKLKPRKGANAASMRKKSVATRRKGSVRRTKPKMKKPAGSDAGIKERLRSAKELEALDSGTGVGGSKPSRKSIATPQARTAPAHELRNSDFPRTYIQEISVRLDDPDHSLTLTWAGPEADAQETGPFRTSPGAGMRGRNCDNVTTSRTSGSKCTPKGTFPVQGFQRRLNSDSRAVNVTWFKQSRGIALHYFPIVPRYPASHGCVRIESKRVSKLIQDNSRIGDTQVVIGGTWTKPSRQWS